jgi:NTE family protein
MPGNGALVLGGGGIAGIAWHTGILHGMADAGLDVRGADFIVGTSAGATVAAQLGSGTPLDTWFRQQVDPERQNNELKPIGMSVTDLMEAVIRVWEEVADPAERRRRIGAMALAADTVPESVRREVVAGRLTDHSWPRRRIATVAVDAESGERCVFDAASGVDLMDAVAASCAVPGVWPPVTIGGHRYVDGGVYSLCNADLAEGFDKVLILAPMVDPELGDQLDGLAAMSRAQVVAPDQASLAAFGVDPLDPSVRAPAARAGYAQGRQAVASTAAFWNA